MLYLLAALACSTPEETPAPAPEPAPAPAPPAEKPKHTNLFKPLPARMDKGDAPSAELIDLGRMLYYDARLSKNHDISCNSCHQLDGYGDDGEPTSPGHKGQRGGRNSPTSYNAALHIAQFWDGRADDVEAQAKGPVLNPIEMALPSEEYAVDTLASIPGYVEAFEAAFPGEESPVTYDNMAIAIGAFERGLVTPGKLDAYLGGDVGAMSDAEKAGMDLFVETGCAGCHMGEAVGGTQYRKLGEVEAYETEDIGRAEATGNDAEKYFFKVPSLRNIAETGPYFHDGSIASLDEAITLMAKHQLGKELGPEQVASIKTFLEALTGEVPKDYIAKPELPESGPDTPAPDPS